MSAFLWAFGALDTGLVTNFSILVAFLGAAAALVLSEREIPRLAKLRKAEDGEELFYPPEEKRDATEPFDRMIIPR